MAENKKIEVDDLLAYLLEKEKEKEKKPKLKRIISEETKARLLDNLKRGRESSLNKRKLHAKDKVDLKNAKSCLTCKCKITPDDLHSHENPKLNDNHLDLKTGEKTPIISQAVPIISPTTQIIPPTAPIISPTPQIIPPTAAIIQPIIYRYKKPSTVNFLF